MKIYDQVLELVQEGLTIQQSCNVIGIHTNYLYSRINDCQKHNLINEKYVASVHCDTKHYSNKHKEIHQDFIEVFRDADSFYSENTYTFKINTKSNVDKEVFQSKRV